MLSLKETSACVQKRSPVTERHRASRLGGQHSLERERGRPPLTPLISSVKLLSETEASKRCGGPDGSRNPGTATSQTATSRVPPPARDPPDSVSTARRGLRPPGAAAEEASQLHSSFHHPNPSVSQSLRAPETR